ncbi:unnamed protein product [Euphydryas editha]|uniref:Phosphatidic acid phosphatase type 2/haloperoxidase domain-containing protein n=1 Tax=Euphydryas editha TaxID=104508 RepID=A0AAU9UXH9_EUPED|nr:unnamed protein product [Euphydryas editha]
MWAYVNAFQIPAASSLHILRPRPDFFYRCFPYGEETTEFFRNQLAIIDGRKSFPSGHSSFAFCSLGFLSFWLREICDSNIIVDISCFLLLIFATLIGVSRCLDNHHHWEDVLVGAVLGYSISYVSYKLYCKPSRNRYQRDP